MNLMKRTRLAATRAALVFRACRGIGGAFAAIWVIFSGTVGTAAAGSSLQTLVLAVGGESTDTTFGPPPGFYPGLFCTGGVSVPSVGLVAAGVAGTVRLQDAPAGPLTDSTSLNTTFSINSFAGSAAANAQYGDVGAMAHGTFTGPPNPSIVQGAEGYGIYHDSFTFNSPTVASGAPGWVQFHLTVDGTLSGKGSAVEINYQNNMATSSTDYRLMRAGNAGTGASYLNTPSGTIPTGFAVGPNSVTGNGVLDTIWLPIVYGAPFNLTFGMLSIASPSPGTTADVNFAMTALLSGISLYNSGGQSVTNFSVRSGSGTHYDASGVHLASVPEPGSLTSDLIGTGLAGLGRTWRRRLA
jgi:hypothetical protein